MKLYKIKIRRKAYDLIASYLSNKKEAVEINEHKSEYTNVTMGAAQGSISGPLLFLLYHITDIIAKMPNDSVICYADDTVLLAHSW